MKKFLLVLLLVPLFFIYGTDNSSYPLTFGPFFIFPIHTKSSIYQKNNNKDIKVEEEKINFKPQHVKIRKPHHIKKKYIEKSHPVKIKKKELFEIFTFHYFQSPRVVSVTK